MIVGEKRITHSFNLPESLSERLKALTRERGSSMTQIVIDALVAFLDRGAQPEIDERYAIRLDRISRQLARTERRAAFVSEALGLFIQHQLTGAAHEPPFDAATAHLGRRRYEAFLQLVWKRMSKGGTEGLAADSVEAAHVPEEVTRQN
jgi:predicted DNA-binding protein